MEASCSSSTWSNYSSVLKKWELFCKSNNVDMCKPDIDNVLVYLTNLFESGLSYSSINTSKSAISTIVGSTNGVKIGEHDVVKRFMKGVFKLRPAKPRYECTWDAELVLSVIRSWPINDQLSLKNLTLKVVSLLALATGQRVQTISSISIKNIQWGDVVQITIPDILKTTRPEKGNPVLILPRFSQDLRICIVTALKVYVQRTQEFRDKQGTDKLLLGICSPHKPVCSQTVSNWLVKMLSLSGIDTTKFKGHSFRHASTSKAAARGISTDTIINRIGWSTASMFAKFYQRPIFTSDQFALAVLKNETM